MAEVRLTDYLKECSGWRFDWRHANCAHFVCEWISRKRGVNPGRDVLGTFGSGLGFARWLRVQGYHDLLECVTDLFAAAEITELAESPREGDVAVAITQGTCEPVQVMGLVCANEHPEPMVVFVSVHGLRYGRVTALRAWRV